MERKRRPRGVGQKVTPPTRMLKDRVVFLWQNHCFFEGSDVECGASNRQTSSPNQKDIARSRARQARRDKKDRRMEKKRSRSKERRPQKRRATSRNFTGATTELQRNCDRSNICCRRGPLKHLSKFRCQQANLEYLKVMMPRV